jgi:hypothetical protein
VVVVRCADGPNARTDNDRIWKRRSTRFDFLPGCDNPIASGGESRLCAEENMSSNIAIPLTRPIFCTKWSVSVTPC